eukprot:TRINITY_DN730_c0_g1_i2.p1 TRINITY_DN730_c0_g1~~TRINITY_DN730_c0_g1_i2.p1  ORF type:complete len:144 (-),score=65.78 TRINITY_DN730_c0_g1_i2:102-533(-)
MSQKKELVDKRNEVHQNKIWMEAIKREKASHQLVEEFVANPKSLYSITEKPNRVNVWEEMERTEKERLGQLEEGEEEEDDTGYKEQMKQSLKTPAERYDFPLTTAQEIGWYSKPLIEQNQKFNKPLASSDITKFQDYQTSVSK